MAICACFSQGNLVPTLMEQQLQNEQVTLIKPGLGGKLAGKCLGPQPWSTLGLSPVEEHVVVSCKTGCKRVPWHADSFNLQKLVGHVRL